MGTLVPPPCCIERNAYIDIWYCDEEWCCNNAWFIWYGEQVGSPWPEYWWAICESPWEGYCYYVTGSPFWMNGHCWVPLVYFRNECILPPE